MKKLFLVLVVAPLLFVGCGEGPVESSLLLAPAPEPVYDCENLSPEEVEEILRECGLWDLFDYVSYPYYAPIDARRVCTGAIVKADP